MTYEEKKQLCSNRDVTLDGKPATISGAMMDFAVVRQLESGYAFEWAWNTVKNIINNRGGAFKS